MKYTGLNTVSESFRRSINALISAKHPDTLGIKRMGGAPNECCG